METDLVKSEVFKLKLKSIDVFFYTDSGFKRKANVKWIINKSVDNSIEKIKKNI